MTPIAAPMKIAMRFFNALFMLVVCCRSAQHKSFLCWCAAEALNTNRFYVGVLQKRSTQIVFHTICS